jgi:hypothetical protein
MDYSRLITTTSQRSSGFVVDAVHGSSVLVGRMTAKVTPWDMGPYYKQAIQISEVSTAVDFQGQGNFNTADNSTDTNLQWESYGLGDSIVISYPELGLNQTKAGVISLIKRKYDVIKNSLISAAGTRFYGYGLGSAIDGLALSTDDGTTTSSYGGLARTTYGTYINGQLTDASGGVISFASIAAQMDLCSAAGSMMESTNLNLTTKTVFTLVEKLVEAKSRGNYDTSRGNLRISPYTPMGTAVNPQDAGRAGIEAFYFRGVPTSKDDQCTSGYMFNLNENHIDFISSHVPYCEYVSMKQTVTQGALKESGEAITTTAWQMGKEAKPTNSLSDVRQILIYGNMVNRNPIRSGVITGITTT